MSLRSVSLTERYGCVLTVRDRTCEYRDVPRWQVYTFWTFTSFCPRYEIKKLLSMLRLAGSWLCRATCGGCTSSCNQNPALELMSSAPSLIIHARFCTREECPARVSRGYKTLSKRQVGRSPATNGRASLLEHQSPTSWYLYTVPGTPRNSVAASIGVVTSRAPHRLQPSSPFDMKT
jgi:hypothetical protein